MRTSRSVIVPAFLAALAPSLLFGAPTPAAPSSSADSARARVRVEEIRSILYPPGPAPESAFGQDWVKKNISRNLSEFGSRAGGALRYEPDFGPLPSQIMRRRQLTILFRFAAFLFLVAYGLWLLPWFRFGAWKLTLYERRYVFPRIEEGLLAPRELRRARRRFQKRTVEEWHPLTGLPPHARLSFPDRHGERVDERIATRIAAREPENMRMWRLYVLEMPQGKAEQPCLLIQPAVPGDWKQVKAQTGRVHLIFSIGESPIGWPPPDNLSVVDEQGWTSDYQLVQCSWAKEGIDPLRQDVEIVARFADDPPGRQYQIGAGAFWSYQAAPRQRRPPVFSQVHLFLNGDKAVLIETNPAPAREVEYSLESENGKRLDLIWPEMDVF